MRNRILAIAVIAGAMAAPIAAQAQSTVTTGVVSGGTVIINDDEGIAVARRPAFREYVIRERVPTYTIPDRVVVGGVLPEAGITYYDVPQTYGATPYRYTVVNGQTDEDQVNGDDEIQEPRHEQNKDSRDQGDDRGDVRSGEGHREVSG